MERKTIKVPALKLRSFIEDVYIKLGVKKDDAAICADVIIESDLRGIESHGIGRLKYYYVRVKSGQHQVKTNVEVVNDSPAAALVDGHHSMGMVVAKRSMQMAIEKARKFGMGSVAVRNSTHFGIAGYYSTMAAAEGMLGFTVTNARPSVAPTFGVQPMLGTNPIAFAAPTDEPFLFIYDGATPITQRGKIEVHARESKAIPEGWIISENNTYLTDPNLILEKLPEGTAAFLPLGGLGELLGGHKGYGLGVMVEILSASLQGGAFLQHLTGIGKDGEKVPFRVGHFFMAINVASFIPLEEFKKTTGDILRALRNSKKAPNAARIYTAGEKEYERRNKIMREGVPVIPTVQDDILFLQKELGIKDYGFGF
jgi:L-2-hydroxycarboxylate dehydrogenase (NAD+)